MSVCLATVTLLLDCPRRWREGVARSSEQINRAEFEEGGRLTMAHLAWQPPKPDSAIFDEAAANAADARCSRCLIARSLKSDSPIKQVEPGSDAGAYHSLRAR